jgi:methylated-DNA-[protein]-cysteine S-methyltransferase
MNRYLIVDTAFGYGAVAFSAEPFKLVAIKLPASDLDGLCRPFDEAYWRIDSNHPEALKIGATLVRYFNGEPVDTPWPVMDLSRFTPSQQAVYRTVAQIPYGQTASYGQVARLAGLPRAARFVGTTMATNPYPVFIPCHRVIKSDGSPGLFGGGEPLKARMLALEAGS